MESDEYGSLDLDTRRFVSWLGYCYCEVTAHFPGILYSVRNNENGICTSVPANHALIDRGLMYHICKDLMVDMPPGFEKFQKMWDDAEPDIF
jgi:hypothetical protein